MKRSTILTCIGAIGVVATGVATAKATPKAIQLLREAEVKKDDLLTVTEKIKVAGPVYIPAILIGASTIACMVGANILNTKDQAVLASAYALLDRSYKEYRRKVNDIYGEDADSQVTESVIKDHYEEVEHVDDNDKKLFWDYTTCRYFEARMDEVVQKITMDDGLECYILSSPFDMPRNYYIY